MVRVMDGGGPETKTRGVRVDVDRVFTVRGGKRTKSPRGGEGVGVEPWKEDRDFQRKPQTSMWPNNPNRWVSLDLRETRVGKSSSHRTLAIAGEKKRNRYACIYGKRATAGYSEARRTKKGSTTGHRGGVC